MPAFALRNILLYKPSLSLSSFSCLNKQQLTKMSSLSNINSTSLKKGDAEPAPPAAGVARLYNMRFCPYAERAVLYLAKKGIKTEIVNIHLQEKPEWYFGKHPKGQVPALEYNGKVVIESGLIPEYLDEVFPESRILPTDPHDKFRMKLITDQLSQLPPSFYAMVQAFKDPSLKEEKFAFAKKLYSDVENILQDKYFGGSTPNLPDYMVFPFVYRAYIVTTMGYSPFEEEGFPGKDYPKLAKWFKLMMDLPEVKNNVQPLEVFKQFIGSYMTGVADYDVAI